MKKFLGLLIVLSNVVIAQETISTDRPGATYSSLVIPQKALQFESGTTIDFDSESFTVPEYTFRYGLLSFLELRLDNSFYKANSEINNGDLFLGLKAQLFRKDKFKMAFLSTVGLSESDRGYLTYAEKLLFAFTINDKSELSANIGVDALNEAGNTSFVYTISYGRSLTDQLGFYVENYGNTYENKLTNETKWDSYANVGFAYLLKDKLQLDAKVGVDVNTFENYFVGAGISFRAFN